MPTATGSAKPTPSYDKGDFHDINFYTSSELRESERVKANDRMRSRDFDTRLPSGFYMNSYGNQCVALVIVGRLFSFFVLF